MTEIRRKITRLAQQPPTTQSVAKSNPLLFLMLNEICQVQFFGNLPKHFEMQAAPTFDENAPLSS